MKYFANWFTDKLMQWNIVKIEDRELYAYGFWQGVFFLLNLATVVVIGLLSDMLWQSLFFTAVYGALRSMAGGYHARTQRSCYIFSILLLLAVLGMLTWFPWSTLWSITMTVASTLIVFLLAPVEDENKPLDEAEQVVYRNRSRWISVILAAVAAILLAAGQPPIAHCIVISVLASAFMLVLGKLKNNRSGSSTSQ